jgi:hypothetical protein
MFEKDPYCHRYLAMFRKAEEVAAKLSGYRARKLTMPPRSARVSPEQLAQLERISNLVQIQPRKSAAGSSNRNPFHSRGKEFLTHPGLRCGAIKPMQ